MSTTLALSATIYKAVVRPEAEGGYWAEVDGLPGCFTQGETLDDVYHNLANAIACHLGSNTEDVRVGLLDTAGQRPGAASLDKQR